MKENYVLGIWDGHDAGAALLEGSRIVFAVNEERLSRRKLEVGFPRRSIEACLSYAAISPADVGIIAASTTDPAKTLTRIFPGLKEEYYLIRRRKKAPGKFDPLKKSFKYRFTEYPPNSISRSFSRRYFDNRLKDMGFSAYQLDFVDHHAAHAMAAATCSGFPECLVITLDGVGDGLSGSIWTFKDQRIKLVHAMPAGVSLGIYFEHATNLMNMRELEDEGKVMALANYAWPVDDSENPLMKIIRVEGLDIVSDLSSTAMFREMRKVLWRYPSEQFAYMAQRVLEKCVVDLADEALKRTGMGKIAAAGGVFSNIKMNMKIAALPGCEDIFVFPHMGDGGLALGAAIMANRERTGQIPRPLNDLYLGSVFSRTDVPVGGNEDLSVRFRRLENVSDTAARLILDGEIILWFQGRMEIGPRALGNRSILARPDDRRIRDRLNILLKKRVWYQPFCPSMLIEDAPAVLELNGKDIRSNRFMTMGFRVREEHLDAMQGVTNIDGTCRPHFVIDENPPFRDLLSNLKKELGYGIVLNTSFNIHGEPLVCSPGEAIDVLKRTGIRYLFMEDLLVENLNPKSQD
ncbi:MAG: Decarbamoylnovobiocin carbamoyltransferase [Syntrophus sp. PtaU1.Bin208]|nr:MAG: Decarbamoylnovobiocin carbamoyltransferase [Syntrophus sp. PtaU1.Bin208]